MTDTQKAPANEARFDVPPLPPFTAARTAARAALPALAPMGRAPVAEVARRRMAEVDGYWLPFSVDAAPYMIEPQNLVTSRRFDSICFVGPARSLKSENLVLNPLAHAILAQPRKVAVFSPRKSAAQEWSENALSDMILNSPELRARMTTGKGGDNIFSKRFRGGCRLSIDWPVKDKLAQRSLDLVIGTDYDAFDDDIGGDGGAFPLMRKRTESAGSRAMTILESSPRKPILDETWTPSTPHEAPPCEGILAIYNQGTRGRYYWTCPDCDDRFEPRFDRLDFPLDGTPAERGAAAVMVCPHCGAIIPPKLKRELFLSGFWLHEESDGTLVPIADLARKTETASYWLHGPAAALAPWSRIVSRYLEVEADFQRTGAEGGLKGVTNTELGLPYLPRAASAAEALSESWLRDRATDHAWKELPADTAFLTVAVDVQPGRFVCQAEAWMPDLSRVVIDRYDIVTPPEGAPRAGSRALDPSRYQEDWDALIPVIERAYPVRGGDHGLRPVAVTCDSAGQKGVTPRAYGFYRKTRATHRGRFFLLKGRGGEAAKRAELRRPETAHQGKQFVARDVPIIRVGTDRLKDEIAASLSAEGTAARSLRVSRFAPSEVFAEYAAERRIEGKGWEKRPGVDRNEALDLSVYALALAIILEAEAINPESPPRWALPGPENLMACPLGDDAEAAPAPAKRRKLAVKRPARKEW
ncbi:terminase large subunit [Dinoroseobacter phage vB_DshS-R4C]|nr:terminase large subunit [Dinoroseobacter phage vB_DshS-R4C]